MKIQKAFKLFLFFLFFISCKIEPLDNSAAEIENGSKINQSEYISIEEIPSLSLYLTKQKKSI